MSPVTTMLYCTRNIVTVLCQGPASLSRCCHDPCQSKEESTSYSFSARVVHPSRTSKREDSAVQYCIVGEDSARTCLFFASPDVLFSGFWFLFSGFPFQDVSNIIIHGIRFFKCARRP